LRLAIRSMFVSMYLSLCQHISKHMYTTHFTKFVHVACGREPAQMAK